MKKRQSLKEDLKLLFSDIYLCPICDVEVKKEKNGSCATCGAILKEKHKVTMGEKMNRVTPLSPLIFIIIVILIVAIILVCTILNYMG